MSKPTFGHDCDKCRFLGSTIGGGHMVDLYVCNEAYAKEHERAPTLVARFGPEGHEYLSSTVEYARPGGHSELWAARAMYEAGKEW